MPPSSEVSEQASNQASGQVSDKVSNQARGPCAGIRVLDLSAVVSGPVCTQALGDLGADVLKIETPMGDMSRLTGGPTHHGLSPFFAQFNRNKRSLALDLKSERGQEVIHRLVPGCDVLVENYRPGVADRMGIGFEVLRELNPGLIYAAISGFGPDGPYAAHPAYDHVVQGLSGMMAYQGKDGEPTMIRTVAADKSAGMTALASILAALLARERGAGGQRIDVPMLDAYASFMLPEQLAPETFPDAEGEQASFDPFRVYATADGHVVGMAVQDHQLRAICEALERPEIARDERFETLVARFSHQQELGDLLAAEFSKWTTAEIVARARERGAPFAPVNDFAAFRADPQAQHSGIVEETTDPDVGRMRLFRHPARFSKTPAALHRRPPRHNEHAEEILALAGYGPAEVAELRDLGVVS
jgi:crotonobetainyl-CoA:carnitine CoA-transferase CaiB-like acyl-CoA transferase